jgi:hypothetical protein
MDDEAEIIALAKMEIDIKAISEDASGRLRATAKGVAMAKQARERIMPLIISKIIPESITSCISLFLLAALRLAIRWVIAEFTPKSLKNAMVVAGIKTIPYKPSSASLNMPANSRVPNAITTVEPTIPIKRKKLPAVEDLPICKALSSIPAATLIAYSRLMVFL